jgi:hypothetical protein
MGSTIAAQERRYRARSLIHHGIRRAQTLRQDTFAFSAKCGVRLIRNLHAEAITQSKAQSLSREPPISKMVLHTSHSTPRSKA